MCLLNMHGILEFFTVFTDFFHLLLNHAKLKASLILYEVMHSQFLHRTIDSFPHFLNFLTKLHLNKLILTANSVLSCNSLTDIFD